MTCRWYKSCANCGRSSKCVSTRMTALPVNIFLLNMYIGSRTRGSNDLLQRPKVWLCNEHVVNFISALIRRSKLETEKKNGGNMSMQNTPYFLFFFYSHQVLMLAFAAWCPLPVAAPGIKRYHIYQVSLSGNVDLKTIRVLSLVTVYQVPSVASCWEYSRCFVILAGWVVHYNINACNFTTTR